MDVAGVYDTASTWLLSQLTAAPVLAWALAAGALIAAGVVLFALLRALGRLVAAVRARTADRALRTLAAPGYKILLAKPRGAKAGEVFSFVEQAVSRNLPAYCFGAPLNVRSARTAVRDDETVRKRIERSGADMLLRAERRHGGEDGLALSGAVRGAGEARSFFFTLTGDRKAWSEALGEALAYLIAKRMSPAIARPSNFKAERAAPVADRLEAMLNHAALAPDARAALEDDFAAYAMHVAEQGAGAAGLDQVIALRRKALANPATPDQARIAARLDLGRALLMKAEQSYDQAVVADGVHQLRQAIDALRADPVLRRAEEATAAIQKAQNMLASRQRFALSSGF